MMTLSIGNSAQLTHGVQPSVSPAQRTNPSLGRARLALRPAPKGFALMEVLVSVVILAIGVVVIMQALANVSHALLVAEQRSTAYFFELSKMGELELALRQGTELPAHDDGIFRAQRRQFTWSVSASSVPDDPGLRSIALTVVWRLARQTYDDRIETLLRTAKASQ